MSNPVHILSFLFTALFWGGSFFSIGIAVRNYPPFFAAFLRVFIAFVVIGSYLVIKNLAAKRREGEAPRACPAEGATRAPIIERPKVWLQSAGTGLFLMGIPWVFLFWGEQFVTPAMASILNSTVPIFTVVLTPLITPSEKNNWKRWLGALIGFTGVALIFAPEIMENKLTGHLQGLIAILLMAICYAIGLLWTRRISARVGNAVNLYYQSLGGSIFLLIITLFFEIPHATILWSWPGILALLYLGIFSTAIAWILFFKLLKEVGSLQAAAVTYCVPIVALLLDFFFWEQWIQLHQGIGAFIILLAVFLIHRLPSRASS